MELNVKLKPYGAEERNTILAAFERAENKVSPYNSVLMSANLHTLRQLLAQISSSAQGHIPVAMPINIVLQGSKNYPRNLGAIQAVLERKDAAPYAEALAAGYAVLEAVFEAYEKYRSAASFPKTFHQLRDGDSSPPQGAGFPR